MLISDLDFFEVSPISILQVIAGGSLENDPSSISVILTPVLGLGPVLVNTIGSEGLATPIIQSYATNGTLSDGTTFTISTSIAAS